MSIVGKFFGITLLVVLFSACKGDDPVLGPPVEGSRTVLVYLAADNSLAGFALKDLEEMKAGMVQMNGANIHLLVYVDTGSSPRLIELKKKGGVVIEEVVKSYGNRNSTGTAETKEVFNDAFNNAKFQAESYGLVYWSHGEGWIPATLPNTRWVGEDQSNGENYMNIEDLVAILETVPHLDYILFDACFMQSIEVAYEIRQFTDYCIGSPTEIPGPGACYDVLVPALFAAKDVALRISTAYYEPYAAIYDENKWNTDDNWTAGVSICALKSAELDHLANMTRQVLPTSVDNDKLRSSALDYDNRKNSTSSYVGYHDFVNVMEFLTDIEGYKIWKQAYDNAVLYWQTTPKNYSELNGGALFSMVGSHGVSHYVPSTWNAAANRAFRSTAWYKDAGLSKLGW